MALLGLAVLFILQVNYIQPHHISNTLSSHMMTCQLRTLTVQRGIYGGICSGKIFRKRKRKKNRLKRRWRVRPGQLHQSNFTSFQQLNQGPNLLAGIHSKTRSPCSKTVRLGGVAGVCECAEREQKASRKKIIMSPAELIIIINYCLRCGREKNHCRSVWARSAGPAQ